MTARDDQPVTVPPPAGEDDAYSATTKVGAMPPDVMEKLRAEGLLPEENSGDRETPASSFRPSTSLDKRTPIASPSPLSTQLGGRDAPQTPLPVDSGAPLPTLFSTAPPALKPDPEEADAKTPAAPTGPPPPLETLETPVAFVAAPSEVPKLGEAAEPAEATEKTGAASRRAALPAKKPLTREEEPPSQTTLYVVAVLVVILLIVALIRLRG